MHSRKTVTLTALIFLLFGQIIKAASYNYTLFNIPGGDAQAADINNLGQVVGVDFLVGSRTGFVYDRGLYTLNTPSVPGNDFFGLNDVGQIVGFSTEPLTGLQKGFLDDKGVFSMINVPGSPATIPYEINNAGEIVGTYLLPGRNENYGFIRSAAGVYTTFTFPGSSSTEFTGLNDKGQIVGGYTDATGFHNFLDTNGQFTTIFTSAYSINNLGQITVNGGVLDPNNVFSPISVPGYDTTGITGINDLGQVVGTAFSSRSGLGTSFIATPTAVPEPGTLALTALVFPVVLLVARDRNARSVRSVR